MTHSRLPPDHDTHIAAPQIVIVEGILALYDERLREHFDMKIFVDADPDVRLARRIRRDMAERGRDLDGVLQQCAHMYMYIYTDLPPPTLTTPTPQPSP